jgi:hypothetical protein
MNNLTENDYKNFADSFITPEIIEAAKIQRVNDLEGAERMGRQRNASTDYSGVVFGYFLPEQMSPREYRLRRDTPDLQRKADGTTKIAGKYLSPPGAANMIYFPPNCLKVWLTDTSIPIVFTEGEKKELALHRVALHNLSDALEKPRFIALGLGGVWNFSGIIGKTVNADGTRQNEKGLITDFHLIEWKGREVKILFDANVSTNKSVYIARQNLARKLKELGAEVYLADCPELPGCNGIDDVLGNIEREQNTDAAVQKCLEIIDGASAFKIEKVSQANTILSLVEGVELFHTPDGEAFASIDAGGHIEHHRLNSKHFRQWLSYQFYKSDGKSPSSQAIQDAIGTLSGQALFDGETRETFIRLAAFGGKIYLDLCNEAWQIIEISCESWRVIEAQDAPVKFRRTKGMGALPTPNGDGDISKLRKFLNVDDRNYTLLLAWLINCFRPDYPFPILIVNGEQGTAKSTTSKLLRELVDPSLPPFRSSPRDERNLIIAASNSWICAFDNLSDVPNWLSDALCRISTGGGFAARTLYENDEETIFSAKRPIILNGIGDIASRPDLLDRSLRTKLEVIPKNNRKPEREFWAEFEEEKSAIFTALLEAVSIALSKIESTSLSELPRMADFALWATAAETGLELAAGTFMNTYTQNREDAHAIVLEDSIIADVLQEFCERKGNGGDFSNDNILLKHFLVELEVIAGDKRSKDKNFPKSSKGLRNALERINPNLREIGIRIIFNGKHGSQAREGASLSLEYTCKQTSLSSQTSLTLQNKGDLGDESSDAANDTQVSNVTNITNETSNITAIKSNDSNSLAQNSDVSDESDVHSQSYSNDNGDAEYVDTEI